MGTHELLLKIAHCPVVLKPLLFVRSNPKLDGTLTENLDTAESKEHWTTCETSDEEIVRRCEHGLDDAPPEPYWSSIRNRAQELFDDTVIPGTHYALTEVVRCPSVNEQKGGVLTAARFCHREWLMDTLEASGAHVIVGAIAG